MGKLISYAYLKESCCKFAYLKKISVPIEHKVKNVTKDLNLNKHNSGANKTVQRSTSTTRRS